MSHFPILNTDCLLSEIQNGWIINKIKFQKIRTQPPLLWVVSMSMILIDAVVFLVVCSVLVFPSLLRSVMMSVLVAVLSVGEC